MSDTLIMTASFDYFAPKFSKNGGSSNPTFGGLEEIFLMNQIFPQAKTADSRCGIVTVGLTRSTPVWRNTSPTTSAAIPTAPASDHCTGA